MADTVESRVIENFLTTMNDSDLIEEVIEVFSDLIEEDSLGGREELKSRVLGGVEDAVRENND